MKNPKMIIFDVDGLLLNTEFLWRKAWKDVAAKYGVPKFGEVFCKVVGISGSDVERVLNNELSDVENRMELLDIARSVGTEYLENDIEFLWVIWERLSTVISVPKLSYATIGLKKQEASLEDGFFSTIDPSSPYDGIREPILILNSNLFIPQRFSKIISSFIPS